MNDLDRNKINRLKLLYESELYDNKGLSANTTNICLNKPFEFEYDTNTDMTNNNFSKSKNEVIVLYIQNRTHRKKRINKKWLKKFGVTERKINCHIDYNMKNICNYEVKINTTELTDFIKEMKQHRNRIYFENPINN
jgi:hypothetical protein|uniref:Uncharacterized protein n=1 Tax=Phage sp. ctGns7 TaxID=2828003 RepID=A0A8S5S9A4_9VIRU|nr:MAG TPA: hypothetical protein [Phage sp. ctGns7]